MKKRTFLLTLGLTAALFVGYAAAVGGDAGDPLISLDFLDRVIRPQAETRIDEAIAASDSALLDDAKTRWDAAVSSVEANVGSDYTAVFLEARIKQGDAFSGATGLQILPLAGEVTVLFSSGAVIDMTEGAELASGSTLLTNHRYLVAEDTSARFVCSSKTAVVNYCGRYHLSLSDTPDYNAMAAALKSLRLFRGTDTGFGSGYDLEKTPTRAEAVIMLIRLLGEEDAALACTSPNPFVDVPAWFTPYAAYAYEKGYSNGIGKDRYGKDLFGTQYEASAVMYAEFLLRALGYSSTATTDISDALDRALNAGVLTAGERTALLSGTFLRADVAYLSYYALSARTSSGTPLYQTLTASGVFTAEDYRAAQTAVATARLS